MNPARALQQHGFSHVLFKSRRVTSFAQESKKYTPPLAGHKKGTTIQYMTNIKPNKTLIFLGVVAILLALGHFINPRIISMIYGVLWFIAGAGVLLNKKGAKYLFIVLSLIDIISVVYSLILFIGNLSQIFTKFSSSGTPGNIVTFSMLVFFVYTLLLLSFYSFSVYYLSRKNLDK